MEFVKVMEIKKRMCSSTKCNVCPLGKQISEGVTYCPDFIGEFPSRAEQILIEWDKAHPIKTFLSDFLEKHPKTTLWNQGFPYGCPKYYGYIDMDSDCVVDSEGNPDCLTCWNRPLEVQELVKQIEEKSKKILLMIQSAKLQKSGNITIPATINYSSDGKKLSTVTADECMKALISFMKDDMNIFHEKEDKK